MLVVLFRDSDWRSDIFRGFLWVRAKRLECLVIFRGNPGADLDPRLDVIPKRLQTVKS